MNLRSCYRFDFGHAGNRVDIVSRQRDIESLSANQLSVSDALGWIGFHRNHAGANGKLIHRHAEPRGSHLQQHPASLGRGAPHGPGVPLHRRRPAGTALVDGDVRTAHDAGGLVVGDVQFIGHQLPETCPGALAAVRLPDIECRGAVLMDDDPRIELSEVGVGIRTCSRRDGLGSRCRGERAGARGAEAHHQQARALEQVPAGRRYIPVFQHFFDLFWNLCEGCHATTSFSAASLEGGTAATIAFAARLMAA